MRTRDRTWDQDPGAAQRSTTRETLAKRLNSGGSVLAFYILGGGGFCELNFEGDGTFVELEEFKGASGSPALFFGEAVVCVALVLG